MIKITLTNILLYFFVSWKRIIYIYQKPSNIYYLFGAFLYIFSRVFKCVNIFFCRVLSLKKIKYTWHNIKDMFIINMQPKNRLYIIKLDRLNYNTFYILSWIKSKILSLEWRWLERINFYKKYGRFILIWYKVFIFAAKIK